MTYSKTIRNEGKEIVVARTSLRAMVFDYRTGQIFERNIWVDEDGKNYVQYLKTFYMVVKTSKSTEYDYSVTFVCR